MSRQTVILMPRFLTTAFQSASAAAVLVGRVFPTVLAHIGDRDVDMSMKMGSAMTIGVDPPAQEVVPSYFWHSEHRGLLIAHMTLMVLGWVFILPIANMLSLARSQYTLSTQFLCLATNAVGVLLITIYNAETPDLYPNNAHHKLGWIVTLVLSAQVVVGFLGRLAGAFSNKCKEVDRQAFNPIPHAATAQHRRVRGSVQYISLYRHSNDSGQGTEPNTETLRRSSSSFSAAASPIAEIERPLNDCSEDEDMETKVPIEAARVDSLRSLSVKLGAIISSRVWKVLIFGYNFTDRTLLFLGFISLATGIITLGRFFEGSQIYTGLAHWIKGGVFFWLGILNLARWAGSFGDLGWAWNIRPQCANSKRWLPTAEFAESFLIFFYGGTNIFLEHLGRSDGGWSWEDLQHISITILFLGGGLGWTQQTHTLANFPKPNPNPFKCGMLIESRAVRDLLNITVTLAGAAPDPPEPPPHYGFSLNPIPALIIMLTGIMMASHRQQDMVSSMLHKKWGSMLTGASFARALTYLLVYLKPPTTTLPARPPTELLAAFGLLTGGVLFMASSGDTVAAMERNAVDPMFMYNVTMGSVGLLMAWIICCVAVKGWALRREIGFARQRRRIRHA